VPKLKPPVRNSGHLTSHRHPPGGKQRRRTYNLGGDRYCSLTGGHTDVSIPIYCHCTVKFDITIWWLLRWADKPVTLVVTTVGSSTCHTNRLTSTSAPDRKYAPPYLSMHRLISMCTALSQYAPHYLNVHRLISVCTALSQCAPPCPNMHRLISVCTALSQCAPPCLNVHRLVSMCTALSQCAPLYLNMPPLSQYALPYLNISHILCNKKPKVYGGSRRQLYLFLTSALDRVQWSTTHFERFTQGKELPELGGFQSSLAC
jgi:hypothetical protein